MEYPKFKVTVNCMTYNQSKYITDAMNGFTMQQTSFPFVCTIVDDASTDGEQDVIRKYVDENFDFSEGSVAFHKETDYALITYAQHKINKNCYFAVLYLKENHYSQSKDKMGYLSEWRDMCEYEALCEGDDYWIVPDKLECQVNYMLSNPDCSLCVHNAFVYLWESKNSYIFNKIIDSNRNLTADEVICGWSAPTASMLYIKEKFVYPIQLAKIYSGDYSLLLIMLNQGNIHFIDKVMSVYRRTNEGVTNTTDKIFAYKDHIRLLESYDIYTDLKYHELISKRIKFLKDLIRYIDIRQNHRYYKCVMILPFLANKLLDKKR